MLPGVYSVIVPLPSVVVVVVVVCETCAIDRVILGRSPPERALSAENEAIGDVRVDANRTAPTDLRLAVAFGVDAADAHLTFSAEASQPLRISLGSADSEYQCERGNSAGMQSPHDCNPFLLN